MDGVRILSQKTTGSVSLIVPILFSIISLIVLLVIVVAIRRAVLDRDVSWLTLSLLPIIIFVVTVGLTVYSFRLYFAPIETTYKVILSDDVSVKEFYEKYKIISQEGEIYEVRER